MTTGSYRAKRDYYAGALVALLGLIALIEERGYDLGSLRHMGPGYFPVILGSLLVVLGTLIAFAGGAMNPNEEGGRATIEWRGLLCIIAGPSLFIFLGAHVGMIPATASCVFVAALGDRTTTARQALILTACVTIFGILLFHYLLKVSMPLLTWSP
jgi:hypothetical protein